MCADVSFTGYFAVLHTGLFLFKISLMSDVQEDKQCCRIARNAFYAEALCKKIEKNLDQTSQMHRSHNLQIFRYASRVTFQKRKVY